MSMRMSATGAAALLREESSQFCGGGVSKPVLLKAPVVAIE
jgi:hypothetical protein